MATSPRSRKVNQVANNTETKIENCVVLEVSDDVQTKSNGKEFSFVRCKLPKAYKELEVLAMVTGSNVPEEGDEVNLYHRVYTDKNGIKRHGFDVQINTGLASADELDNLFK